MKIIAIAGRPGVGKSKAIRRFMSLHGLPFGNLKTASLLKYHEYPEHKLVILGDYQLAGDFPGTDRLSMAVAPEAASFLSIMAGSIWKDWTVLLEGDRLTGRSFLEEVAEFAELKLLILECTEKEFKNRQFLRGNKQGEKFLAGRKTKVERLVDLACRVLPNNNEDELDAVVFEVTSLWKPEDHKKWLETQNRA